MEMAGMGLCTPFLLSDLPIRSEIGNGSFLGNAIGKRPCRNTVMATNLWDTCPEMNLP